jgi:hypothetical protein
MISIQLEVQLLGIKTQKGGVSYGKEDSAPRAAAACFRIKSVSSLDLHPLFSPKLTSLKAEPPAQRGQMRTRERIRKAILPFTV